MQTKAAKIVINEFIARACERHQEADSLMEAAKLLVKRDKLNGRSRF